jgi:hypothetical protein
MRRSLTGLANALDTLMLEDVELDLSANRAEVARLRPLISSDRDLTRQVLAGANRWDSYLLELQLNRQNQSK